MAMGKFQGVMMAQTPMGSFASGAKTSETHQTHDCSPRPPDLIGKLSEYVEKSPLQTFVAFVRLAR